MALDQKQKDFISAKIKELGSLKAVKELYNQDCLVDKWANVYASTIFTTTKNSQAK